MCLSPDVILSSFEMVFDLVVGNLTILILIFSGGTFFIALWKLSKEKPNTKVLNYKIRSLDDFEFGIKNTGGKGKVIAIIDVDGKKIEELPYWKGPIITHAQIMCNTKWLEKDEIDFLVSKPPAYGKSLKQPKTVKLPGEPRLHQLFLRFMGIGEGHLLWYYISKDNQIKVGYIGKLKAKFPQRLRQIQINMKWKKFESKFKKTYNIQK